MPLPPRAAWAVLAVALLPRLAPAGPIAWSYHAEVSYAQDYGSNFVATVAPGGAVATAPGAPVRLQLLTSTGDYRPRPGSFLTNYDFGTEVTITDLASGQGGTVHLTGWYRSWWSYPPGAVNNPETWRLHWQAAAFGGSEQTLDLGGNRYTVGATVYVHDWTGGGFPSAVLAVEAGPVATPEPGTLALAGLGLAAVGLLRARRRTVPLASPR